ncbi:MAG TPA: sulfatase [Actinomycetota bacterium]
MGTRGTIIGGGVGRLLRTTALAIVTAVLALGPTGADAHAAPLAALRATQRPNIVFILTDDQRWDTLQWMPNVKRLLVDHGVTFTNAFVPNGLCCPSRVSILTGQYSHTNGVWDNTAPFGGYTAFHGDHSTIATWLHAAGYDTALIGKYLNQYKAAAESGDYPPGWDTWISFAENNGKYTDYDLTVNGHLEGHHNTDWIRDFSTDLLTDRAVHYIRNTSGPFFLYFAPFAPHEPYDEFPPADECPALPKYDSESFGEEDVSDKPAYVNDRDWTAKDLQTSARIRAGQCRMLSGVDRSVARIVSTLEATNQLSNTMIVFMGDNGYMWGEHRLFHKGRPYDEANHIPMVVRYDPWTSSPRTESRIALNLDIAPTFAALGDANAPGVEGRSLVPLLKGEQVSWRQAFLLEHTADAGKADVQSPDYCGLRSVNWMYAMYLWGAEELYNLRSDPAEMVNLARVPSAQAQLKAMREAMLRRCDPLPPRFPER